MIVIASPSVADDARRRGIEVGLVGPGAASLGGAALSALIAAALAGCAAPVGGAREAVIFGTDDRVELYDVEDAALREFVARTMPAMVHRRSITIDPATGDVSLRTGILGERRGLCPGEAHADQPTLATCSSTLIDDDLVLTAGHCVESIDCADQRYAFGWWYDAAGELHGISADAIYACAEIVAYARSGGDDFAVVRLDRPPPGPPAQVRRDRLARDELVSLGGYPLGLPMKVVERGPVTGFPSASTFWARLDAHPGNSGSGVIDAELRVAGELFAGPIDAFDDGGTCTTLRVIGEDDPRTEFIQSMHHVLGVLCAGGGATDAVCCGDGTCADGEACETDCAEPDAGAGPTADGGPSDAGRPILDAGIDAAVDDAAVLEGPRDAGAPSPDEGGGCGCRASGPSGDASAPLAGALAILALVAFRRRRRSPGAAGPESRRVLVREACFADARSR